MKGKDKRPRRQEPTKGENIVNNRCMAGQDKSNKNFDTSKNSSYFSTRERVLHALRNIHTIQEVADELGISYQAALYHINRLCEAGEVTAAGYFGRKSDGRIVYHYQETETYYRQNPGERKLRILNDIQKRLYMETGKYVSIEKIRALWK